MARPLPGRTPEEKLQRNRQVVEGCWRWTGAHTRAGYGHLRASGKRRQVHRLAFELWVGPIPAGLEIDHLCRVRDCINPKHLEAVTRQENLRRKCAAVPDPVRCLKGHVITGANVKLRPPRAGYRRPMCRKCFNENRAVWRAMRKRPANA